MEIFQGHPRSPEEKEQVRVKGQKSKVHSRCVDRLEGGIISPH